MSFFASLFLLLLLAYSFSFLCKCKPAYSLFVSFCAMIVFLSIGAVAGLLWAATFLFDSICIALFVLTLYRQIKAKSLRQYLYFFSPSMIIFLITVIVMAAIFALQKPMFIYWDEFAFWGTAAKVTKLANELYTTAPSSLLSTVTPCGSVVLSYFFQFFARDFSEPIHYLASVAFYFSAYTVVAEVIHERTQRTSYTALAFMAMFFLPFIFRASGKLTDINMALPTYTTAMVDLHISVTFAAILAMFFLHKDKKWFFIPLVVLPLFKDIGLVLGMLAGGLIAVLLLFSQSHRTSHRFGKLRSTPAALLTSTISVTLPFFTYMAWTVYMSATLSHNQFNLGGEENMSMPAMLFTGVKALLYPPARSEKFNTIFGSMINALLHNKSSFLGNAFVVVFLITAIFAIVFFLTHKPSRRDVILLWLFSLLGFIAYFVFLGLTYVYIFRGDEGYVLADFDRYLNTYFIAWFMLAFAVAGEYISKKVFVLKGAISLVAAAFASIYFLFIGPLYSFAGANNMRYQQRLQIIDRASQAIATTSNGDRVFVISQGDEGLTYMYLSYELYPATINSIEDNCGDTVGTLVLPSNPRTGEPYIVSITTDDLRTLLQNDFDYLYIDKSDDTFPQDYGLLFSDNLQSYHNGSCNLYKVDKTTTQQAILLPVVEEVSHA